MNQAEQKLCLKIAKDKDVKAAFGGASNAYSKICQAQKDSGIKNMHLPEPWNGKLSEAKIMFISSNPSIDKDEEYPTEDWDDEKICGFFENRFKNGKKTAGGEKVTKAVSFWTGLIKYTNWISKEADLKIPEICKEHRNYKKYYAELNDRIVSTEIVHCKSEKEKGVAACEKDSHKKWTEEIVNLFTGKVIVLFGKYAKSHAEEIKKYPRVKENEIKVLCLSHPNARGLKAADRIDEIQKELQKS